MKKHTNINSYNVSSQENAFIFFSVYVVCSDIKKDFNSLINQFELLFKEKLPIIYANIRV